MIKNFYKSTLFKSSSIYTISSIINAAIPFLLLPVLTKYLTPFDYGLVSMFALIISFTNVFVGLNIHGSINREFFNEETNFKVFIFNSLIILCVSGFLLFVLIFTLKNFISKMTSLPPFFIYLAVVFSFFQFILLSLIVIYQAKMNAKKYAFFQVFQSLLNTVLSLFFIVILLYGWEGRVYAQLFSMMLFSFIAGFILYKNWIIPSFNFGYIKKSLSFGVPLIPHTLGSIFIFLTDRIIIAKELGLDAVGIYTVGFQVGSVVMLFADAFNKAYSSWLFKKLNEDNLMIKNKIVKFTYWYFFLILIFAFLFGLVSPLLIRTFLDKNFVDSIEVVMYISLGGAFAGMYYMVSSYIAYVYKTMLLGFLTFIIGVLNIPITYYLVKFYGLAGASCSFLVIQIIFFITTWIASIRIYNMPWFSFLNQIK